MYGERFSRFFQDQATIDDWCTVWGEGLAGLSGEQIKYGLGEITKNNSWPPTMVEFRACCKSAPAPYKPLLEAPKHGMSSHTEACMEKIRHMLENPKKPGIWWKQQVRDKAARGEAVTLQAMELANAGRQE